VALQYSLGCRVGLLSLDTPITKLLKRYFRARYCATHKRARPYHTKVAVQIPNLGLAWRRPRTVRTIEQMRLPCVRTAPKRPALMRIR
jgi:hypothetical protein